MYSIVVYNNMIFKHCFVYNPPLFSSQPSLIIAGDFAGAADSAIITTPSKNVKCSRFEIDTVMRSQLVNWPRWNNKWVLRSGSDWWKSYRNFPTLSIPDVNKYFFTVNVLTGPSKNYVFFHLTGKFPVVFTSAWFPSLASSKNAMAEQRHNLNNDRFKN